MNNLKKCTSCEHQIDKNAKTCPNCGKKLKINLVAKFIIFVIAVFILISLLPENKKIDNSQTQTAKNNTSIKLDPIDLEKQKIRDNLINEWLNDGYLNKIRYSNNYVKVYVSDSFNRGTFNVKQKNISVIYDYYSIKHQISTRSKIFMIVYLYDNSTHKKIGEYSSTYGLNLVD